MSFHKVAKLRVPAQQPAGTPCMLYRLKPLRPLIVRYSHTYRLMRAAAGLQNATDSLLIFPTKVVQQWDNHVQVILRILEVLLLHLHDLWDRCCWPYNFLRAPLYPWRLFLLLLLLLLLLL